MDHVTPCVVLASYAEPLLDGRRGIVFGDSTSPLAEEMIGRGARSVHVCDPEPARAGEAAARNRSRQISIVPLDDVDVAVREGAFDVAIVEDLSNAEDATALLKQVRRALSPRGVALVASPNPDAKRPLVPRTQGSRATSPLGYYELYDKVAAEFDEVRMLGQTPFVGYAIVDFAPADELDVELDSGFLPTGAEEPEWFIAVGAREPPEVGAFSIVQLPASRVVGSRADERLAEELAAARAAEAKLGERLAAAEAEIEKLGAEKRSRKTEARERVDEARAELEARNRRIVELEARVTEAENALESANAELGTLRERAADADRVRGEHAAALTDVARLERELGEARADSANADKDADVGRLEESLRERGEHVRKLETELREAERLGRELVRELATRQLGEVQDGAPKPANFEELAAENARLRADFESAQWTIQELENRLDHALRRGAPAGGEEGRSEAAFGEPEGAHVEPDGAR